MVGAPARIGQCVRSPARLPGGNDGEVNHLVVRALERDEYLQAAAVAARALRDAPTSVASYGDDPMERMARIHRTFVGVFEDSRVPQLGALCDSCPIGVAMATPPGRCVGSLFRSRAPAALASGEPPPGDPAREQVFWASWAEQDLPEDHWHLGPVGVEPEFQGLGIGGEILRQLCSVLDSDGSVGWLETDKEINVRFYDAHGFEVVERATILGVPTWYMRRDPSPSR